MKKPFPLPEAALRSSGGTKGVPGVVPSRADRVPAGTGRCPICGQPLTGEPVVDCRRCETGHHRACFEYNRLCGTFACGSRLAVPARVRIVTRSGAVVRTVRGGSLGWALLPTSLWGLAVGYFDIAQKEPSAYVSMFMLLIAGGLAAVVVGTISVTHEFDPEAGEVRRQTEVCGLKVSAVSFSFDAVRGLEVVRQRDQSAYLYLRATDGERVLLAEESYSRAKSMAARAEAIASVADVSVYVTGAGT